MYSYHFIYLVFYLVFYVTLIGHYQLYCVLKNRRNWYVHLVKVLYCKTADQWQVTTSFPTRSGRDSNSDLRDGRPVSYHCTTVNP